MFDILNFESNKGCSFILQFTAKHFAFLIFSPTPSNGKIIEGGTRIVNLHLTIKSFYENNSVVSSKVTHSSYESGGFFPGKLFTRSL